MTADPRLLEYQVTCIGGLEDVAADELRALLGPKAESLRVERGAVGRLFFHYEGSPRQLFELGCATGIAAVAAQAHDVTAGRPGLERVLRCLRQLPLDGVRRIARACQADVDLDAYELSVTARGAHRFGAPEVADGAHRILRGTFGLRPAATATPLRLSLQVHKRRALLGVHLGPRRPTGDPQREGWPGPAAWSVARMLDLGPGDLVLQVPGAPGCRPRPAPMRLGPADGSPGVRIAASRTLVPLRSAVAAAAFAVPLDDGPQLAEELAELTRVVAPGGVLAVLVRRGEGLAAGLRQCRLPVEVMAAMGVYVRRRRWALFLLERLELIGIDTH